MCGFVRLALTALDIEAARLMAPPVDVGEAPIFAIPQQRQANALAQQLDGVQALV